LISHHKLLWLLAKTFWASALAVKVKTVTADAKHDPITST